MPKSIFQVCGFDGKFIIPEDTDLSLMSCRAPKACPTVPQPPAGTNLKAEPDGVTISEEGKPQDFLEHQNFEFVCLEEFTLAGVMHELVEDLKVKIPCRLNNGSLQVPEAWPPCRPVVDECTELPAEFNRTITNSSDLPVSKDESATFTCTNSGKEKFFFLFCDLLNSVSRLPESNLMVGRA